MWCTYKYLCGGPGSIAQIFVNDRHGSDPSIPRLSGWFGNTLSTRFRMAETFEPAPGADGWQLSNLPILALAPVRASLAIFDEVGMAALRAKTLRLTPYLAESHRCHRWRRDHHAARSRGPWRPAQPSAAERPRAAGSPRAGRDRRRLPRARHHPRRPGPDVQHVPRRLAIRPGPRGDDVTDHPRQPHRRPRDRAARRHVPGRHRPGDRHGPCPGAGLRGGRRRSRRGRGPARVSRPGPRPRPPSGRGSSSASPTRSRPGSRTTSGPRASTRASRSSWPARWTSRGPSRTCASSPRPSCTPARTSSRPTTGPSTTRCAGRAAWPGSSRRGTCRCTCSPGRSRRPSRPATPSSPSRPS